MKSLFDTVSFNCSKLTTRAYSTSFSLGIYCLNKKLHNDIYAIYGLVRFADEIVDSFHNYDKTQLLNEFRSETFKAIKNGISLNPILNSFQHVVNKYQIETNLIDFFFNSMQMDIENKHYDTSSYNDYILGSAEVVGLMCLYVFTNGNKNKYDELKQYAMFLGSAFQKVNFLRDIKADYEVLGRTYFPSVDFNKFSHEEKRNIESDIENDLKQALVGIKQLPVGSRFGVYVSYVYYRALFKKIKSLPPNKILYERVRIPNYEKLRLLVRSYFLYNFKLI